MSATETGENGYRADALHTPELSVTSTTGDSRLRRVDLLTDTVRKYKDLENLENAHPGKPAHGTFLDDLYSRGIPPVLGAMYTWAGKTGNETIRESTTTALQSLNRAVEFMNNYASDTNRTSRAALAAMQLPRNRQTYADFTTLMDKARKEAISVISEHLKEFESVPEGANGIQLEYQRNGTHRTFLQEAQLVLQEDKEATMGVDLGLEFRKQLHDPTVRLVVVMLDINSTLNMNESFANLPNLDSANNQVQLFAEALSQRYPDKHFLVVPNTGRPADYERGVIDMLPAYTYNRVIGLAEAGGVRAAFTGSDMSTEVPIKNEWQWQRNLDNLYAHLNGLIEGGHLWREHKLSMLSIQTADPQHVGGRLRYKTKSPLGEPTQEATTEWVQQQVSAWFEKRAQDLEEDLANGNGDPGQNREELAYLVEMQKVLKVKFNPTAGFIDIYNMHINKFSSSLLELRRMGVAYGEGEYSPEQMLVVHIGDTMTDLPPDDLLEPGEPNYGSNRVFVVAVGNAAPAFKEAVAARRDQGKVIQRYAALGVRDVILGMERDLEEGILPN